MGKKTPLYECHLQANAKIVDFAGWDMPIHYGSQLKEHQIVRADCGMFDVSHMTIVDLTGADAEVYLRYLLANNVDRLVPGKALYTCMLNSQGGVIDDLIVYQLEPHSYRLIVNSATHDKDIAWLLKQAASWKVTLNERKDLAMLAVQGPNAVEKISEFFTPQQSEKISQLKPFSATAWDDWMIARTGYTGEDGVEIILPAKEAAHWWNTFVKAGIHPCGLGARDTLRLEAGLNLYGVDMDESVSPLESNLAWTVAFQPKERDFIGRAALEKQMAEGIQKKLVGLILETSGVLRNHQAVRINDEVVGEITSGSFSPTLGKGIALARVPVIENANYQVEMRGKWMPVKLIQPPFVRREKLKSKVGVSEK